MSQMNRDRSQNQDMQAALRNVLRILDDWGATSDEVCRILSVAREDFDNWRVCPPQTVGSDVVERIVLIESISNRLNVLFPLNHARWPKLPNDSPAFGGVAPMSVLATGHVADIRRVERWLAGWMH